MSCDDGKTGQKPRTRELGNTLDYLNETIIPAREPARPLSPLCSAIAEFEYVGGSQWLRFLIVVTGASYWTLKDGSRHPTGYWAEEFVAPYSAFTDAGHEVVVATPHGVVPHVDVMSLRPSMAGSEQIAREQGEVLRKAEELRRPIQLANARLEDYDAVYYPGGHGPMEDLAFDADSGRLLAQALASSKPLGVVCLAPAGMLATE